MKIDDKRRGVMTFKEIASGEWVEFPSGTIALKTSTTSAFVRNYGKVSDILPRQECFPLTTTLTIHGGLDD